MKTIDIYRPATPDYFLTAIYPDNSSTQQRKVMGENQLNITFEMNSYVQFMINDYCTVFGEKYILHELPIVTKGSSNHFKYSMVLKSETFELSKYQYLFYDSNNDLSESEFSVMGNAETFIDLLIVNANRVGSGWTKGEVTPTAYKNISFSKDNCYNALVRLAEEFETEFVIEGKKINLIVKQKDTGYIFKVGKGKGLYEVIRNNIDSSSLVTRIYPFGSEKNLPADYYSTRLRLPDPALYLEKNVAVYGIIEHTEIFDDIYPQRTGKITSVNVGNVYEFIDTDIDFNINDYLLPGMTPKVVFNTGQLAGYEFEISSFDNGTKEIVILQNKNERVLELPNASLKPAIGDEYVLVDLNLPLEYIEDAENRLSLKAQELLDKNSIPQVSYQVVLDPVYIRNKNMTINPNDLVWIKDDQMGIERKIRVNTVTRNIVTEIEFQIELSDIAQASTLQRVLNSVSTTERDISAVDRQVTNTSILNNNVIGDLKVKQGTIIMSDIPTTGTTTGFEALYIETATGKIFKKV
jgi:hypothetical protein